MNFEKNIYKKYILVGIFLLLVMSSIIIFEKIIFKTRTIPYSLILMIFVLTATFLFFGNDYIQRKYHPSNKFVLLFCVLVCCIFYYVLSLITRGTVISYMYVYASDDTYMDFFHSLDNARYLNPYDNFSNYPPLALLIFKILYRNIPIDLRGTSGFSLRDSQHAQIIFLIFIIFCIYIIMMTIEWFIRVNKSEKSLIKLTILISMPIMFTLERGNIILLSFSLAFFFIFAHNSKNKLIRELTYLSLAIAAAIKIYPAIFGLILVKEKKYKEALRTTVYGLSMFFLPFILYDGLNGLKVMLSALQYTSNIEIGYGVNLSAYNIVMTISSFFGIHIPECLTQMIPAIVIIILLISFINSSDCFFQILILSLATILVPKTSYFYSSVFMIIPFVYLCEQKQFKNIYKYCSFLISLLIIPLPFGWVEKLSYDVQFPTSYGMIIQYLSLIIMFLIVSFNLLKTINSKYKKVKILLNKFIDRRMK